MASKPAAARGTDLQMLRQIRSLVVSARRAAARQINTVQLALNFEIGRCIVQHEQGGEDRAAYGLATLQRVSAALSTEFGRGFSLTNLKLCRSFYLRYRPPIGQTVSDLSVAAASTRRRQLTAAQKGQTPSDLFAAPAGLPGLSWSHFVFLMRIEDDNERRFYELESQSQQWSLAELRRQFDAALFERLALSRNKARVKALASKGHQIEHPLDLIKDPLVLEFLGLEERAEYSENDLETAIIDRLGQFLLELGKGFLFEARQKRFSIDGEHFYVDLVFYNRLLRCYVLVDLKLGKLSHQDLGQMQMYVNHYDRHVKLPDEAPTVGIVLCKMKSDAVVRITLPKHSNITAARYLTHLPDKDALKQQLLRWADESLGPRA